MRLLRRTAAAAAAALQFAGVPGLLAAGSRAAGWVVITCPRICRRPRLSLHLRNRTGQLRKRVTNRMRTHFRPCHASL